MATGTIGMGITNGSNTNGYYTKFPDGTLIQWGIATIASGQYTASAVLPQAFLNGNYAVILTDKQGGTQFNLNNKYTTYFTMGRTPNTAESKYEYVAIGRWK